MSHLHKPVVLVVLLAACTAFTAAQNPVPPSAPEAANTTCHYDARQPQVKLSGSVADPSGAAIPASVITLKCGSFHQNVQSAADGTYNISAPAGSYQLQVEAQGFEPLSQLLDLSTGSAKQDFTLKVGQVASIVSVTATGSFVATASTTSTKTDTPLIETPQSVSVVTEEQMTSRGVQTINQAIEYTPGVGVNTFGTDSRFDYVNIRGFDESTYGIYRDNSRWQSGQVSGEIDPYMIQEVDVIKGPSSVLYGQNTPGGLINLVTKRPPLETSNEVVASFGAFDRKQIQEDLGGPIAGNSTVHYRFTSLYRNSDTQVNYVPDDRWFLAPALTWTPDHNTTWTILSDYQHDNTGWGQFLPSQGTLTANPNGPVSTSFFAGEPGYDFFHRNQWSVGSLFEHHFGERFTLRNTYRHSSVAYNGNDVFGDGLEANLRTLDRFAFGTSLHLGVDTTDTQLFVQVKTGIIEHSILVGLDYSHSDSLIVSGFASAPSIDLYQPVYGATIPSLFTYYNVKQPIGQTGLYFQDHVKIARRIVATLSGRQDWTTLTTDNQLAATTSKQTPDKFTGRAGITYLAENGIAPYFSYSTSFLPTAGVTYTGTPFAPTEGRQFEAGVKLQPRRSHSFITASWFQIDETNVLTPDTAHPNNSVQTGAVRSRGVEFEGVASVAQGLNLHASYSYLDESITKANDGTVGKRPTQIPDQLFGITSDYTFSRGPVKGLGAGLGVRFVGTSAGNADNSIIVPTYTLVDATLRYIWKSTELQVNATNLGDTTYVAVCQSVNYCNYGNRRNIIGSLRYHWSDWSRMR